MMDLKVGISFCDLRDLLWAAEREQVGMIRTVKGPLGGSRIFFAAKI